jgi:glutamate 5-kinase
MYTGPLREQVRGARCIVVKVGSSSLAAAQGGLSGERVDALVDALEGRLALGAQIVLVSSGAIAAGLAPLGLRRRPRDLASQQAAASVGQGLLIARYTASFARYGRRVGQILLTVDDVTRHGHYRNARRTFARLLPAGVVPIVNENDTVATQEIKFGDNDRLAALVAHLVEADLLVLLSDVDGLYDADPRIPGSRPITDVRDAGDLESVSLGSAGAAGVGTGGMVTKVEAARIATDAGISVVLTAAAHAGRALRGEPVGTLFHAAGERAAARLLWLAHATSPRGALRLAADAVHDVVRARGPVLPAGVTAVEGDFNAGDPVDLLDETGARVARGLVNYDSVELPGLLGRAACAEPDRQDGVLVHPDQLALVR